VRREKGSRKERRRMDKGWERRRKGEEREWHTYALGS